MILRARAGERHPAEEPAALRRSPALALSERYSNIPLKCESVQAAEIPPLTFFLCFLSVEPMIPWALGKSQGPSGQVRTPECAGGLR